MEPTRMCTVDDARHFLVEAGIDVDAIAPLIDGKFMSAFIRAEKPSVCAGLLQLTRIEGANHVATRNGATDHSGARIIDSPFTVRPWPS